MEKMSDMLKELEEEKKKLERLLEKKKMKTKMEEKNKKIAKFLEEEKKMKTGTEEENKKLERLLEEEKKMKTETEEENKKLERLLEEEKKMKTETEEENKKLERLLEEEKKMKTKMEEENKKLARSLQEAEHENGKLKENIQSFTWIAYMLLLIPLCMGLRLAFKGHELNHHELRLMLVGKTGTGKSASGNTILGEEAFRVEASPASVTASCVKKNKVLDGKNITIIDTPGVMDTWLISNQKAHHAHECISKSSPDPHVFLLVIRLGRFTVEESNAVKWIQENFGEEALKFTIILFTGGDLLEGKPVEEFISNSYELQNLVDTCQCRYHVFNNYDQSKRTQVSELFEKINVILHEKMGYFYTKECSNSRETKIRQEEELKRKHMEEEMKMEERRKVNEMAIKLRDEQYENKNLNVKLEGMYIVSFLFMVLTVILIVILITVCSK